MKKTAIILFIALLTLLAVYGCEESVTDIPPVADIYSEISSAVELPEFIEIEAGEVMDFFSLDAALFSEMKIMIGSISTLADELVICKAVDEAAAMELLEGFSEHVKARTNELESYLPDEYAKLKDVKVKKSGLYIYYAVSGDEDVINNIFVKYFK